MSKYLFTDGINGVKELQSQEELQALAGSAPDQGKIRIWLFSSNEWISYITYQKNFPFITSKEIAVASLRTVANPSRTANGKLWLKKFLIVFGAGAGVFLIFNFTKIKWTKAAPVNISSARPANVPVMDIDSLIRTIEVERGVLLDRSTRANLRLRNTWPERIELKLHTERETSNPGSRFFNTEVSIDNTTGFNIDDALVKLSVWTNGRVNATDTLLFNNIPYDKLSVRKSRNSYRGDSIAVSFESIRAKSFNFCYSSAVKNNSGNYNDRWFCRE